MIFPLIVCCKARPAENGRLSDTLLSVSVVLVQPQTGVAGGAPTFLHSTLSVSRLVVKRYEENKGNKKAIAL